MRSLCAAALLLCVASACVPAPVATTAPAFPERLRALGTEPFWSLAIDGGTISYSTADRPQDVTARVARSEVNGTLRLKGRLASEPIDIEITRAACSDGMSDRSYPYAASIRLGQQGLKGCAHSPGTFSDAP